MKNNMSIGYRPTWAEINLKNLEYNFNQIKRSVSPDTKIMVTVKADAYGHGSINISRRLSFCGVDYLGVASIDEGIELRRNNIKIPILILGVALSGDIDPIFKYDLMPSVCTEDFAHALNRKAAKLGRNIDVHIKVDTGMGRVGVLHHGAFEFVKYICSMKHINVLGIFTHFAFADLDREFTEYQIDLFNRLVRRLRDNNIHIPLVHAANSVGTLDFKDSHFNMIRPGLIVYGLHPKENLKINLKPVLSLKTKVIYAKKMPKGAGISYGHIYVTKKSTTIVTLPIGYGDGYPRNLSNVAPVLIKGKRFKISGRICMDQIMVDVGNSKVKAGDEVVLIGSQGKSKVTAEELAKLAGTIPYEIVCGLGSRIPRVYVG